MELKETEKTTEVVLERMENTMMNLEQMSFDSINITDRIVTLLSDAENSLQLSRQVMKKIKKKHYRELKAFLISFWRLHLK